MQLSYGGGETEFYPAPETASPLAGTSGPGSSSHRFGGRDRARPSELDRHCESTLLDPPRGG